MAYRSDPLSRVHEVCRPHRRARPRTYGWSATSSCSGDHAGPGERLFLDEPRAQHVARSGEDPWHAAAFRYPLREGRIALLFDGFDELALRTRYERVPQYRTKRPTGRRRWW
jgi:hypothetical protein